MPRRLEPNPLTAAIGARVYQLRTERNMTLEDLARVTKVGKGHISTIENGFAAMTVPTIVRLAKGLDLPPLYLLIGPSNHDHDQILELLRQLPRHEILRIHSELTKKIKGATRTKRRATRTSQVRSNA